jgi:hypothetical protein
VTFALGAAQMGCGGTVTGEGGGEKQVPDRVCPATFPSIGAGCSYTGPACTYGDCGGTPTQSVSCVKGVWEGWESTCNPPVPDTVCPAAFPTLGSGCSYTGPACTYGDCSGSPTQSASCVSGVWEGWTTSCNPPPPPPPPDTVCPSDTPISGTYCNYVGPDCTYGDCYGEATEYARCTGNAWTVTTASCNPPPPDCPLDLPQNGAACSTSGMCPYPWNSCGTLVYATCDGDTWQVDLGGCDPYPDAGPSDRDAAAPLPAAADGGAR